MNNWLLVQQFTILRYYSNIHSIIDILLCILSRFVWSGSQVLTLPPMYTRSVKAGSSTSGPSCASFPPFTSDLGEKCLLHQVNSAGKTWKQHGNTWRKSEHGLVQIRSTSKPSHSHLQQTSTNHMTDHHHNYWPRRGLPPAQYLESGSMCGAKSGRWKEPGSNDTYMILYGYR